MANKRKNFRAGGSSQCIGASCMLPVLRLPDQMKCPGQNQYFRGVKPIMDASFHIY